MYRRVYRSYLQTAFEEIALSSVGRPHRAPVRHLPEPDILVVDARFRPGYRRRLRSKQLQFLSVVLGEETFGVPLRPDAAPRAFESYGEAHN